MALLPGVLFCMAVTKEKKVLEEQIVELQTVEESQKTQWIYVLAADKTAGEQVLEKDLEAMAVSFSKETVLAISDQTQIVGKRLKCNLKKGSIVQAEVLYDGVKTTDDQRALLLDDIELPKDLSQGEFFDIRIFFPTGEDFVVLSKKTAERIVTDDGGKTIAAELQLGEEELLLLASAFVDRSQISGTRIYAVTYIEEAQDAAVVNYPIRSHVEDLLHIDPNVTSAYVNETNETRRALLESHLESFGYNGESGQEVSRDELIDLFG